MSQGYDPSPANIKTFVILDLETTGLLHREGKKCRIIEISLVAVLREHLVVRSSFPRVLNKLCLCINPDRPMDVAAMSIHGLSNSLLEDFPPLSNDDYTLISSFLRRLPPPLCLVAHNGTHFDFPLLKSELQRLGKQLPDDLHCVDTLPGFRSQLRVYLETRDFLSKLDDLEQYDYLLNDGNDDLLLLAAEKLETLQNDNLDISYIKPASQTELELKQGNKKEDSKKPSGSLYWRQQNNETTPSKRKVIKKYYSYKLDEIYKVLLSENPVSHRAESDVMNLLECIHVIGGPFVEWMDKNCYNFQNVRLYC